MANFFFLYNQSDGSMYSHYYGDVDNWTNIPQGCSVLGPLDETNSTAQQAFAYPERYGVQNGVLSMILSDADLLKSKQQEKNVELKQGYEAYLLQGFQVTIGTTAYTLGWSDKDKLNLQLTNTAINKGDETFPVYYTDINGNPFVVNTQADLDLIESTATKFYVAQHQQLQSLKTNVQNATLSTVDSITWQPAPY